MENRTYIILCLFVSLFLLESCFIKKTTNAQNDKEKVSNRNLKKNKVIDLSEWFMYNKDSLNFYKSRDIASVKKILLDRYKKWNNEDLIEKAMEHNLDKKLSCDILRVGISKNIPDAFAILGFLSSKYGRCEYNCSCDEKKAVLYLRYAISKKSTFAYQALRQIFIDSRQYKKAELITIESSKLKDKESTFLLALLYLKGKFNIGYQQPVFKKFIDRKKGEKYLEKAVSMNQVDAIFLKAILIKDKKQAFELLIRAFNHPETSREKLYLKTDIEEQLHLNFSNEWSMYKKKSHPR